MIGTVKSQFLFTPFENESSFKGDWNLSQEVPNYIAAYLREFYKVNVMSSTSFLSAAEEITNQNSNTHDFQSYTSIANEFDLNYLVTGKVIEFNVSRFSAGETNIAGYEAYNCEINILMQIFDLTNNKTRYAETIESSVSNKGVGLNLFGVKSDEKKQYLSLNELRFGGEEFNKTIVGEAMFLLCEDLSSSIKSSDKELLYPQKLIVNKRGLPDEALDQIKLKAEMIKGLILTYDEETGEAFINLGSSSKIDVGDELAIFTSADSLLDPVTNEFLGLSDKSISVLDIVEVRGEKLSLAYVQNNRDKVRKGMEVRKYILNRGN